ncbi:hypothetical protein DL767_004036 [Monosporascus sp. MG133]|nr:hypothetical protein DL767_004036 [Monosporascus sp. MG133]
MTENPQPSGGATGGRPDHVSPADFQTYQAERAHLKQALNHRANLRRQLAQLEASIANHETEYLEGTPSGNIITGFDNYTKGTTSAAAQRRRTGLIDQNRVFSRSSVSYNALNPEASDAASSTSTPGAPTPISTTFANNKDKDGASSQATPTSATERTKGAAGGSKKKKARASAAGGDEESETDTPRETKKVRTNFGARK